MPNALPGPPLAATEGPLTEGPAGLWEPSPEASRAAAAQLEATAPGYLAAVRAAAARLGRRDDDGGAGVALDRLGDSASFDLEVPTRSRIVAGTVVKQAVKRSVGWYLRYLAEQMGAFAGATEDLCRILVERADAVEGREEQLRGRLAELEARIARLERTDGP